MKRITIKEIANKAGVSIGTVDRVLHDRPGVAPKTKNRILEIVLEAKYKTNVFARTLKLNKTLVIAILLPNDNEYWETVNKGIVQTSMQYEALGMSLVFYTFDRHDAGSFQKSAQKLLASEYDGVVLAPIMENETLEVCRALEKKNTPFVFIDSNIDSVSKLSFIGQDSKRGGYLSAKLLNLGFPSGIQSFIVRFHDFDSLNKTVEERIQGFKNYYQDHNFDPVLIQEIDLSKGDTQFLEIINKQDHGPVHIFEPNSRAHQMKTRLKDFSGEIRMVGFDLITENHACLKSGLIDFIIDQNPTRQGELAIQSFYSKLILNIEVKSTVLMSLEIFTRENLME